jgi:FlaA1/EpsC-like NDP-sugar epimerase
MQFVVVGATGQLGQEIVRQLASKEKDVWAVSRNEYAQWLFKLRLNNPNVKFRLTDITSQDSLKSLFNQINTSGGLTVIHVAALKHIDIGEENKEEYNRVNVGGLLTLVNQLDEVNRGSGNIRLLFVSSDKACYPSCTYGANKLEGEGIVLDRGGTVIRPGNYIEANGNIVERLQRTSCECFCTGMTRFFSHIYDIASLIVDLGVNGHPQGIYCPKAKSVRLGDVFEALSDQIVETKLFRKGEKMHEHLVTKADRPCYEAERFFYIGDRPKENLTKKPKGFEWVSNKNTEWWTKEEIKSWLNG